MKSHALFLALAFAMTAHASDIPSPPDAWSHFDIPLGWLHNILPFVPEDQVLTIHVYDEAKWEEMLDVVDATSPYALTGAVFSQDRYALHVMVHHLRHAAGNFYINDKPTGAVVGQQPFGGARMSGTNDKAGSSLNLLRWISPGTIKETFVPATEWTSSRTTVETPASARRPLPVSMR